jgi:hypothetical protein
VSLLRTVIRSTAVGALRDQTWAQERVADSSMTPIAQAVYGGPAKPYICVYTDRDDISPVIAKAEVYNGQTRMLQLTLEIGVASAIRDPTGKLGLVIAATDEGMEIACDVTAHQALAALIGNPQSIWGDLFKQTCRKVHRILTVRGGQSGQGVKYAARRIVVVMSTIFDAAPGVVLPATHPINQFIRLARSNTFLNLAGVANVLEPLMTTINAPTWQQAQAYLGLDRQAIQYLNPDGTPLPVPLFEQRPYDPFPAPHTADEYVPPLDDVSLQDDDNPEQVWPPIEP